MADKSETMTLIIQLKDRISKELKNVTRDIKLLPTATKVASRGVDALKMSFTSLKTGISNISRHIFSLQGMLLGLGVGLSAKSFLDVASSFEAMEVKLEVLTKGKGKETLEALNEWALKMPVNTQKAVESFAQMMAMGLNPTIDKLQTLVDVASIFGDDALSRVSLQLGQMSSAARISSEDLNTIAQTGLNVKKYLIEAYGRIDELQKKIQSGAVDVQDAINVIWKGMEKEFAGSAIKMQTTWSGLKNTFISFIVEIQRKIMDAGVFDALKQVMIGINAQLEKWLENNKELLAQEVPKYVEKVKKVISELWEKVKGIKAVYDALPDGVIGIAGIGIVGRILFGGPGGILLATAAAVVVAIKAIKATIKDVGDMNIQELEKKIISLKKSLSETSTFEGMDEPYYVKQWRAQLKQAEEQLRIYKQAKKELEELEPPSTTSKKELPKVLPKVKTKASITTEIKAITVDDVLKWDAEDIKKASETLLSELDYMYDQGVILAEEYYSRKRDMLTDDTAAQIAVIEEMIKIEEKGRSKTVKGETTVTKDLGKIAELNRQILTLEEQLNTQLTELDRKKVQSAKEANDEMLQQKTALYDALKWKSEGYLEFRVEQLAKEALEFAKHIENQALAAEWLEMRKKELLDEYLTNTNEGYALLTDMSQRTAEAIEQSFSDYLFDLMQGKFDTWRDILYNLLLSFQRMGADVVGGMLKTLMDKGIKSILSSTKEAAAKSAVIAKLMEEKLATIALSTAQGAQVASVTALTTAYWGLAAAKAASGMGGGAGLYDWGGVMQSFAGGGEVKGFSPTKTSDNILAKVTAKEFIQPVDAVEHVGIDVMEGIRRKAFPRELFMGMKLPKNISIPVGRSYASGGSVIPVKATSQGDSGEVEKTPVEIKMVNYTDLSQVTEFLSTTEGENAVLNIISNRQTEVRRVIR